MVKIMEKIIYYDEEKNTLTRLKLVKKYFKKHPYIIKFKLALEEKKNREEIATGGKDKKSKNARSMLRKFLKKLLSSILALLSDNLGFAFKFAIIYVTYKFCSDNQDIKYYMYNFKPFDLSLLIWSLLNFILPATQDTELLILRFGINFCYPMFLLGMFSRTFVIFYRKDAQLDLDIKQMDLMKNQRLGAFFLLLGYAMVLLIRGNTVVKQTEVAKWYLKKKENIKGNKDKIVDILIEEFIKIVIKFSRIIALISAIQASLQGVNLWNILVMITTLTFFWTNKRDKNFWPLYIYFNILVLLLLFFSQLVPLNVPHFNQEITTMLGTARTFHVDYKNQFFYYFLTCLFCSIYNKYKDKVLVEKEIDIAGWKKIKKFVDGLVYYIKIVHVDYIVWIYHLSLFALLSYETSDFFTLVLFCLDIIIFLVHLRIFWSKPRQVLQQLIRKTWYPSFFLVLAMITLRYLSFFIRYRFLRHPLE